MNTKSSENKTKMKKFLSLILAALMIIPLGACSKSEPTGLQAILERKVEKYNFGGVIRITRDGKTLCETACGSSYTGLFQSNTMDSRFCIGSVSKQFAAASVMLLKERGLLSIDNRLDKYFPEYKLGKKLTIKNLLTMRSGIAEFYGVTYIDDAFTEIPTNELEGVITNKAKPSDNRKLLKDWLFSQPLCFEPDSEYAYSNSNFFLLAEIVSQVSGVEYEDFVRQNIFEPLGMKNSGFIDENWGESGISKPSVDTKTVYTGITRGLGDIISCADDMDLWLTSIWELSLLSEASVEEMSRDYCPEDDCEYGYGIIPDGNGGLYHFGYFSTYFTMDYTNPEKHLNLFAVTNDDKAMDGELSTLCQRLIEKALREP